MADSVYDNVSKMWFGTKEKMGWIDVPESGADVSPQGSSAESVLLDGGGFVRNSWDSHKRFQFGWPDSSSRELASLMHGYANGSYGRGLIYFQDPMYYDKNVLARRIADPSMAIGYEAPSWLASIDPTGTPTGANPHNLPVTTAVYNLPAGYVHDPADGVWVPIPEGHELWLGAIYSSSNPNAGVIVDDGSTNVLLAQLATTGPAVVSRSFTGIAGVTVYPGYFGSNSAAATISITAMTARIRKATGQLESYTNLFTNPESASTSGTVEVRRNLCSNPSVETSLINWGTQGASSSVTIVRSAEQAHSGNFSIKVTAAANQVGPIINSTIVAGAVHTTSCWIYSDVENTVAIYMSYFTGGTFNGDTSTRADLTPGWNRVSFTNSHPTATTLRFGIRSFFNTSGQVFYVDDVLIEQSPKLLPYFSGATDNDSEFTYTWVGTANESASIATAGVPTGIATTGAAAIVWRSFDGAPNPGGSFVRLRVDASSGNIGLGFMDSVVPTGGASYTITTYARAVDRDQIVDLRIRTTRGPSLTLPKGQWVQISSTIVSGTGATNGTGILILGASPQLAGDFIDFATRTLIGPNLDPYTGQPFSGSTTPTEENLYVWDGVQDASTSTLRRIGPIKNGPWYSGEGHSGCKFVGKPTLFNYTGIGGGQVGLAATLKEVGSWL